MTRTVMALGVAGLMLALAACSSATREEQPSIYSATMAKPVSTDVYPVIEGKLPAASAQMSNEEAVSLEARLTALGSARSSGKISEAEYQHRVQELRLLAANHGSDTLKEIQN
ncbi:MAG TPA: SHOCT domain-containing protein [Pararhizobium sp.]|uniref:SHOCT domain-containing protein n=1 Tax=Pararhizobium sp. TaxID=1977563 RepID=UPI002CEBA954|nr:SHOCT domain-containing protein [Pararhizobium sp.]HTO30020.1 SHOCT domain-containing protein [Pararhizobium sp.]